MKVHCPFSIDRPLRHIVSIALATLWGVTSDRTGALVAGSVIDVSLRKARYIWLSALNPFGTVIPPFWSAAILLTTLSVCLT